MQQTQDTPQPQNSQTQNQQNNSSNDITYESTPASSTASADSNCLIIDEDGQDEHNVTKDIFCDHTDDSSEKATDKANHSDNCNDEDEFDLKNSKTFDESSKKDDPTLVKQQTRRYNQTVTVVLPTTEQIISLQKWNDLPIGELPATERRDVKGKFAKAVMGSPPPQSFTLRKNKPPTMLVKLLRPFMVRMTV